MLDNTPGPTCLRPRRCPAPGLVRKLHLLRRVEPLDWGISPGGADRTATLGPTQERTPKLHREPMGRAPTLSSGRQARPSPGPQGTPVGGSPRRPPASA